MIFDTPVRVLGGEVSLWHLFDSHGLRFRTMKQFESLLQNILKDPLYDRTNRRQVFDYSALRKDFADRKSNFCQRAIQLVNFFAPIYFQCDLFQFVWGTLYAIVNVSN